MIASFAGDWGPTIAGAIVGTIGVLGGLATARLTIRAQARARRDDQAQQLELVRGDRQHDLQLRHVEFENERRKRLEEEILASAAELSGNLTSARSRLNSVREDRITEDLDEIEVLLRDARNQGGRLSLLLGGRSEVVGAAFAALYALDDAVAWLRQGERVKGDAESLASAHDVVSRRVTEGGKALMEFYVHAQEAGITGVGTGSIPGSVDEGE